MHLVHRLCWPAEKNLHHTSFSLVNTHRDKAHHQAVSAGFQSAEADAEQDRCGEGVVVDEAMALGVTMVTI